MPAAHQLAVVMFSDIAGSSASMQKQEENAIKIKDKYRTVLDASAAAFNGKVVHYYGDGCLSIFTSVKDAFNCFIDTQAQYRGDTLVAVRIGLYLGDIVTTGDDVYGDGVNLASRIESAGIAGCILLSDKVKDELHNHPEFKTVCVGKYQFKNIDKTVEVFALDNEGLVIPLLDSLQQKIEEKTTASAKATDRAIREHPYESIGIAFGIGVLIGVLINRK